MAIWSLIHNTYSDLSDWIVYAPSGEYTAQEKIKILDAMKVITTQAKSFQSGQAGNVSATAAPKGNILQSGNDFTQEYEIKVNGATGDRYYITLSPQSGTTAVLSDANGAAKSSTDAFSIGDTFKIKVTVADPKDYSFKANFSANVVTDAPVCVFAEPSEQSLKDTKQNYVFYGQSAVSASGTFEKIYGEEPTPTPTPTPTPNPKPGKWTIYKTDVLTVQGLKGVTFDVYNSAGQLIDSGTTDASGIYVPNIKDAGTYTVIERETDLYQLTEPRAQVVTVSELSIETHFRDYKRTTVETIKEDAQTGKPVPGCEYEIIQIDGKGAWRAVATTDAQGRIIWDNVPDGTYMVREVSSVSGYILDKTPQYVTVRDGMSPSLKFLDSKFPGITISKVDKQTGAIITKPTTFHVEQVDGTYTADVTTVSGVASLQNIPVGTYKIMEKSAPEGYVLDATCGTVFSGKDQSVQYTAYDLKKPILTIEKIDGQTGKPIAGVRFDIKKADGMVIGTVATGNDGKVTVGMSGGILGYLDPGVYTVTEVFVPQPYVLSNEHKDITLSAGDTKTLMFANLEMPVITVEKYDEKTGEKLSGAQFAIYEQEDLSRPVAEGLTDANGQFSTGYIQPGTYVVKELNPPPGYMFSTKTSPQRTIVAKAGDGVITVKVDNIKLPELIIKKIDAVTQKPLAGFTFKVIETDDTSVQPSTVTTGADGTIHIPGLKTGTYTVEEIAAPSNYIIDTTPQTVKIEGGDTKTLLFQNTMFPTLVIVKTDYATNKPIANATFRIDYENHNGGVVTIGAYKTNANGRIVLPYVQPGWYSITETIPAQGYQLPTNPTTRIYLKAGDNSYTSTEQGNIGGSDTGNITAKDLSITSGLDYPVVNGVVNYPLNSVVIKKADANTGEMLSGATFELIRTTAETSGQNGTLIGTYTTNASGVIVVTGLEAGAYAVRETKAPTNYLIAETDLQTVNLKADGTSIVEVIFRNLPYGSLLITKVDAKTGLPLSGATFKVTDGSGAVAGNSNGEFVTNSNGEILIPNLKPDSYVVTELAAPNGYVKDTTPQTVNIGTDGKVYKVHFQNQPIATIVIKKYDAKTKAPLANADFKVTNSKGEAVGTNNGIFRTDEKGTITIPDLPKDSYILQEIKAPTGYILENQTQTVAVDYGKTYTIDFYNQKMSGLQIIKIDSDTKQPLKDAKFNVYKKNGELIGEFVTDGNGLIILDNLESGWYKISETKAPSGYLIDETAKDVEVTNNQFLKVVFENKKLTSLIIHKTDDKSGAPLSGAMFNVTKQNGEFVGDFTTDKDGTINIPTLQPDWYIIREKKAPDGYLLDETPKTVEIKTNVPTVITFTDKKLTALEIIKTDEKSGEPLNGAKFVVEKQNGERIGEYTTSEKGIISIPTLLPDWYIVKEIKAPDGYLLDESPKTVQVKTDVPTVVKFTNKAKSGFQIIKIDAKSGTPLPGAKFTVYKKSGDVIGEYTTDQNGVIILDNLDSGWYKVAETKAPDGYVISDAPKDVELTGNQFLRIVFENKKMTSLQVKKIDAVTGKALPGAKFTVEKQNGEKVYTNENGTEFTTDAQGLINIPTLTPDYYIVREVKAPDGYVIDETPKTVQVKTDSPTVVTFENKPLAGLKIIKINSVTRNPIEGVEFAIAKMNGEKVANETNGYTFKTDKTGQIYIPNLADGNYVVTETKAADGYILAGEPRTVIITSGKPTILEVENQPSSGLLIVKTDAQTVKPLQGVMFDVKKADGQRVQSSILDSNQPNTANNSPNKTTSPNGDISGSYTTDANGRILINTLSPGEYNVVETKALDGYVLDTDVHNVTVTPGNQAVLRLSNKPLAGLRLHKIDSFTGKPIYNVEFMVFDKNGKVVGTFYTDNNGMIDFSAILTEGRYTIRETRAAQGYYRDDTPRTVEFIAGKMTDITWKNVPEAGQVQITKLSQDDNEMNGLPAGTPLEGAIFEVIAYKSGNVVDRFITDSKGRGVSNPLPLGRYLIKEVQAPQFYKMNTKQIDLTIEFANQIVKSEFTDESANVGVSIDKTGPKEVMQGQQAMYTFKTVRNDSTIALNDFYWRDTLPVDAVRLDKIVTGTYNQALKYKITVTTNKGNSKVIADNLKTTKNNVIGCTNAELGLPNDEFVTSFTLYFGTVKAGFTSVDEPKVYVNVLKTNLPNGYQFGNKADVGGKSGGDWVIGNSTCVTTIYNPTPTRLPKTGN